MPTRSGLWSRWPPASGRSSRSGPAVSCRPQDWVVWLIALLLSPPDYLLRTIGLFVMVLLLHEVVAFAARRWWGRRARHRPLPDPGHSRGLTVIVSFVVAIAVIVFLTLPNMWLPSEVITVHSPNAPQEVVVGSVLSTDGNWTTIVRAGDRGLSRYRSGDVVARQVCHMSNVQPPGDGPLIQVLLGQRYASPNLACDRIVNGLPHVTPVKGSLP